MTVAEAIEWMRTLPDWGVYLFIGGSSFIENVFPPWPGDAVIVFGGFLAAHDVVGFWPSLFSSVLGNVASGVVMYFAGVRVLQLATRVHEWIRRPRFLHEWLRHQLSHEELDRARVWFERWGLGLIIVSRFLTGIRIFVIIAAGLARMRFSLFLLTFTAGVFLWNVLLTTAGYTIGENWGLVLEYIRLYSTGVMVVLGVLGGGYLAFRIWRARQNRHSA